MLEKIDAMPWRRIALFIVCAQSLSYVIATALPYRWFSGPQDFFAFYFGALHLGTPQLYDYSAVIRDQAAITGVAHYPIVLPYVRWPFYALLFWPLTLLGYQPALLVWKFLALCGMGAAGFWVDSSRKLGILAVGISLAVGQVLKYGQDTWVVLLLLCAFFRILRERPVLAGLCVGLAIAIKPNLFLPLLAAIALAGSSRLRIGAVLSLAGATALSALIQGAGWPIQWLALLDVEAALPNTAWMPTIAGIFAVGTGHAPVATGVGEVIAVAIGIWAGWRLPVQIAAAVAIVAGLMGAPHSYAYDLLLAIPGCILIARRSGKWAPLAVLTPFVQFPTDGGMAFFGPLLIVSAEAAAIMAAAMRLGVQDKIHADGPSNATSSGDGGVYLPPRPATPLAQRGNRRDE